MQEELLREDSNSLEELVVKLYFLLLSIEYMSSVRKLYTKISRYQ